MEDELMQFSYDDFDNAELDDSAVRAAAPERAATEDEILSSLNDEQRAAALKTEGPVLIIAGAGSGKTRVLTSRIALLVARGADPSSILALTFTKKAASEMRDRIGRLTAGEGRLITAGTFHSVLARMIRPWVHRIGFPEDFTIFDEEDTLKTLRTCIRETLFGTQWKEQWKNLDEESRKEWKKRLVPYDTTTVASRISRLKNGLTFPARYKIDAQAKALDEASGTPLFGEIYASYMHTCRRAGAMDFDDILLFSDYLLARFPEFVREVTSRYRHILIDEFQDTNLAQWDIIRRLSVGTRNICIVGDDSQSIYSFRGARIENILGFTKAYPDCTVFRLVNNYRSSAAIVGAANRLIDNNATRIPKECVSVREEGSPVDVRRFDSDRDEAAFVADTIAGDIAAGGRYSDNAVLYRTNAQARIIEDMLRRRQIPYRIYSGISFFNREEIKDVTAYLRLMVNPDDDAAFERVVNRPSRGIGEQTVSVLKAAASIEDRSLHSMAKDAFRLAISDRSAKHLKDFHDEMEEMGRMCEGMDALEAIGFIIDRTGIRRLYERVNDDDGQKKAANIDEMVAGAAAYVEAQRNGDDLPATGLRDYLADIALLSETDRDKGEKNCVSLMTAHCAKGLEFPTVFLTGAEHRLFPLLREDETESIARTEEERRLFYVAVTRAMDHLHITACGKRMCYGKVVKSYPSRFIREMRLGF